MTNEISKNEQITVSNESLTQKFFMTTGRIGRLTLLKRSLALIGVEFLIAFVLGLAIYILTPSEATADFGVNLMITLLALASIFPQYCLNVKRLHDIGKDSTLAKILVGLGIWGLALNNFISDAAMALSAVLTVVSLVFTFYLLFTKGEDTSNKYGDIQ